MRDLTRPYVCLTKEVELVEVRTRGGQKITTEWGPAVETYDRQIRLRVHKLAEMGTTAIRFNALVGNARSTDRTNGKNVAEHRFLITCSTDLSNCCRSLWGASPSAVFPNHASRLSLDFTITLAIHLCSFVRSVLLVAI
jgi:hypothetical protein